MPAEVRSVVVRLTAETAQYIAQMQAAGRTTAQALTPAEAAVTRLSRAFDTLGSSAEQAGGGQGGGRGLWSGAEMIRDISGTREALEKLVPGIDRAGTDLKGKASGGVRQFTADLETLATSSMTAGAKTQRELERTGAASERMRGRLVTAGKAGATLGGLAVASSGLADSMGLANTATYALTGAVAGPWGAAIGGAIGLMMDLSDASGKGSDAIEALDEVAHSNTASMGQMRTALRDARGELKEMVDDTHSDSFGELLQNSVDPDVWVEFTDRAFGAKTPEDKLRESIRETKREMDALKGGPKSLGSALEGSLGPALGYTADEFDRAAMSASEFESSLRRANDVLGHRSSYRDYTQSIRDAAEALGANGKGLNPWTQKGSDNQAALDSIAASATRYAKTLKGLDRVDFLANAREQFVAAAEDFGMTDKAAARLADRLKLVARQKQPELGVDASGLTRAERKANAFLDLMGEINGSNPHAKVDADTKRGTRQANYFLDLLGAVDRRNPEAKVDANTKRGTRQTNYFLDLLHTVDRSHAAAKVDVNTSSAMDKLRSLQTMIYGVGSPQIGVGVGVLAPDKPKKRRKSADGGTVPKTGLGYADRHLYLLADGEEIVSNRHGQADRFRADRAAGLIPAYAEGGTVGAGMFSSTSIGTGAYALAAVGPLPKGMKATNAAIDALRGALRDLRGDVRASALSVRQETRERDRLSTKVDTNQAEVDRLTGLYADLSATIKDNLTSDQFAAVSGVTVDPWRSTTSSTEDHPPSFDEILGRLDQDTANANAMAAAETALSAKGLAGAALQSVLSQGLETSRLFAGQSPEDLARYQSKYGDRETSTSLAGDLGAGTVYAADLGKANSDLAESKAELKEQTQQVKEANRLHRLAERQRDHTNARLDQMEDHLKDIRSDLKRAVGAAQSGKRDQR